MLSNQIDIVLVEDDEVDAELIIRSFRKHKLMATLFHVINGLEALEFLKGDCKYPFMGLPSIILLDINMPLINGLEFLQALRQDENLKQSVVFIVTSSDAYEDKTVAYNNQVAGYILKKNVGRDLVAAFDLLDCAPAVV
ncbi:MAG: response regulator [Chloroflexi bacterium]|nr:response regulator [Chloroflexota bacterium]